MMDANEVISQAADGHVKQLAQRREVSVQRMYEILGKDCPYPKAKRLIRDLAEVNPACVGLIKADLDAMWADILGPELERVTDAEMHEELYEAMQARLRNAPTSIRLKENRDAIEVLNRDIAEIENGGVLRDFAQGAVERRNLQ